MNECIILVISPSKLLYFPISFPNISIRIDVLAYKLVTYILIYSVLIVSILLKASVIYSCVSN